MGRRIDQDKGALAEFDFEEVVKQLSAIQVFNRHPDILTPLPMAVRQAASHCKGSQRPAIHVVSNFLRAQTAPNLRAKSSPDGKWPRPLEDLQEAAAIISTPAPPWRLVKYMHERFSELDRYAIPFAGFDAKSAALTCAAIFQIVEASGRRLFSLVPERAPGLQNATLVTPSRAFVDAWWNLMELTSERQAEIERRGGSRILLEALTTTRENLSEYGTSTDEFCILKSENGTHLISSAILAGTMLTSIPRVLLRKIPEDQRGEFGLASGRAFEKMVRKTLEKHGLPCRSNVKLLGTAGDIDVFTTIAGQSIHIQCKSRMVKSHGKWTSLASFESSLVANILEALGQSKRSHEHSPDGSKPSSSWIVVEADIPSVARRIYDLPEFRQLLDGLGLPFVVNFFDLEYLLTKLSADEWFPYLEFREKLLKSGNFGICDEYDVYYLFKRPEIASQVLERNVRFFAPWKDDDYYDDSIQDGIAYCSALAES